MPSRPLVWASIFPLLAACDSTNAFDTSSSADAATHAGASAASSGAASTGGRPGETAGASTGASAGSSSAGAPLDSPLVDLFEDSPREPTTITIEDGALVTRVADRGRRRHEPSCISEALGAGPDTCDFDNYHFMYWSHDVRTVGWTIRDTVASGGAIDIELDMRSPHAQNGANAAQNVPHLRCFTRYGTVTDFYQNYAMTPVDGDIASATRFSSRIEQLSDSLAGGSARPLAVGDLMECEITLRWRELVELGFQANYYSRRVRYLAGRGGLWGYNRDANIGPVALLESNLLGGRTTDSVRVPGERDRSFMQFVMNGTANELRLFLDGRRLFRTSLIDGTHDDPTGTHDPAAAQPVYETVALGVSPPVAQSQARCAACHVNDGNGPRFDGATRAAPALIGMGLIEAIAARDLLDNEAEQARDESPVKGRVSRQEREGRSFAGRFGWTAEAVSVREQTLLALENEMGVAPGALPEPLLEQLVTYVSLLAVPAPRASDVWALPGAAHFSDLGCARCHLTRRYVTGGHRLQALRGQTIQPMSDLLLHDLGQGQPFRTTPLWGLGLKAIVRGEPRYWHDDSATSMQAAIELHGGEGAAARDAFVAAPAEARQELLDWLDSL